MLLPLLISLVASANFCPDSVASKLTLDEKIALLVGADAVESSGAGVGMSFDIVPGAAGTTVGVERPGIPQTVMADGPAGLRIAPTREGSDSTFFCTHFPVGSLTAASWNCDLARRIGEAIGQEVRDYGVDVILAPGINLMRNPLCGRNFEYFSEDPLLAGSIAAAWIIGVQSNGVGTSLKHYAANNQEINRFSIDARVSQRALRELYLKGFEIAVKQAKPWTVMTSYNRLNGEYVCQNPALINGILRGEWGFDGLVVSDWGGGVDAAKMIAAGNDLLMPGEDTQRERLKEAVTSGELPMAALDSCVVRMLRYIARTPRGQHLPHSDAPDLKAHSVVALEGAREGMVLLKNTNQTLPLDNAIKRLALFGTSSYDMIAGGSGSGDVNHAYVVQPADALIAAGFQIDPTTRIEYEQYIATEKANLPKGKWYMPVERIDEMGLDAQRLEWLARNSDAAVITIGKNSGEFVDRRLSDNFHLNNSEQTMVQEVSEAFRRQGKPVVVVLNICGPIEMESWQHQADAILLAWLPGQEGGTAIADILTGKVNPSGKLPTTFPKRYSDVPSAANFALADSLTPADITAIANFDPSIASSTGHRKDIDYTNYEEDVFVGYRHYDTAGVEVSYPFGHGLSYTRFDHNGATAVVEGDSIHASVNVINSGGQTGREVVMVFASAPGKDMPKPLRELRGFAKTRPLLPGESQRVEIAFPVSSLASWSESANRWVLEPGVYTIAVGNCPAITLDIHP